MGVDESVAVAMGNRALTRAAQVLTGIVTGIVADGHLHDMEIQLLSAWLSENSMVTDVWPGSAIARLVNEVMADGVITPAEREHLLLQLQQLVGTDFSETGSVTAGTDALPYDQDCVVSLRDAGVCLTGEFLYGTRAACERLTEKVGGVPLAGVSKKAAFLVVGTHVSPQWVNTSYGRKIMRAMELREQGHSIFIVPEKRWLSACEA